MVLHTNTRPHKFIEATEAIASMLLVIALVPFETFQYKFTFPSYM